jgi:hypothetical protein
VTPPDLATWIEQYRQGLEAELVLLRRLQSIAVRQRETSRASDVEGVQRLVDERDSLMSGVMAIEHEVRGLREQLSAERDAVRRLPGFAHVAKLHGQAEAIVKEILDTDRDSIRAMEQIVLSRRAAAQSVEQGATTLAAYRRLVAPPTATLVNRRG